jgi:hypothetical protein
VIGPAATGSAGLERRARGEGTERHVILRTEAAELRSLPYDLLQAGQPCTLTTGDLFPNLRYAVVAALERSDFDALYHAQRRHHPGTLGEHDTKNFVLRHAFDIAPALMQEPADLLRVLLRRHYRKRRIPAMLAAHLVQLLRQHGQFPDWPLEHIVPDRAAFFGFLQQCWPRFLKRWLQQHQQPDMAGAASELSSARLTTAISKLSGCDYSTRALAPCAFCRWHSAAR